jgi:hypothetical protein
MRARFKLIEEEVNQMAANQLCSNTAGRRARLTALILMMIVAGSSAHALGISVVSSTIPSNGDLNPYGLAVVPTTTGALVRGNLLVSNFNNSNNLQGTGTTIVQISPNGSFSLFAQIDPNKLPGSCPGGIGLTTALVALKSGWVIVGSLPTTDGTAATAQAGCLLVLDSSGNVVETFFGSLINGPWDMTAADGGSIVALFVTNVLNGTVAGGGNVVNQGTVLRLDLVIAKGAIPSLQSMTIVGSGFPERTDRAALVIGPTGVGLSSGEGPDDHQVLYVADSLKNRIAAISDPLTRTSSGGTGTTVTKGGSLNDPLGLIVANGNIITMNGNDGFAVATTPDGHQAAKVLLDSSGNPPGAGALFGLAAVGPKLYFVDDAENDLKLFQ